MSKYIIELDDKDKEICKQYIDGKLGDELGDYVNVTELAEAIANGVSLSATINTNVIEYKAYCKGLEDGKKIARPKGEWILQYRCLEGEFYTCSQCKRMILIDPKESLSDYPYCHCGADMRGEEG